MALTEAIEARGVVCAVGAGGKKTLLYTLAERVDRAVVTATVRIPIFDEHVAGVAVTDDPAGVVSETTAWPIRHVSSLCDRSVHVVVDRN
nr:hypothetical protein [Halobacterium bonnevillei]